MKKYIFIGLGGFLGAVLRFLLGNVKISGYDGAIPMNTLFINVTGSFVLALVLTVGLEILTGDKDVIAGISTGFLGAYTTFSTLCKEIVQLLQTGYYYSGILYMVLSVVLGFFAACCGVYLSNSLIKRFVQKEDNGVAGEEIPGQPESEVD